ncbi:MAG: 50S ribosomal protein L25 [Chloroflexi bacterium]|nr:50S ribosomal protein L25 [Chloroflexota bacterium]
MADNITLSVTPRTTFGKKNRALRRTGVIPVHVYGQDQAPLALQAGIAELRVALRAAGATTPVTVNVAGGENAVTLVRDIAVHPVNGSILHVDFMRVDITHAVEAVVPLVMINEEEAPGIRGGAGVVTQAVYEITVLAKPFDIPHEIEVDCSVLVDLDADIKAGDLKLPSGVELVSDADARIAWIQPPRVAEETEEAGVGEGEEGAAGEEEGSEDSGDE